ncbi:hypothetical protein ACFPJ1_07785 [Kribbella qitaiheensis]|uniref:hypothetical protein n=1 Tax=Kribbella qitaiheensis TaxID=1544730 RepID=UPI00360A5694
MTDVVSVWTWLTDTFTVRSYVDVRNPETSRNSGVVHDKRKARLDAQRGTGDQTGSAGHNAPAGVRICGGLPGGRVCRERRAGPALQHLSS